MSIYGSLRSGVSGLFAQSQSMSMISDNIANANTRGYKKVEASFANLVTVQSNMTKYSAGGVNTYALRSTAEQGLLESSTNSTDMAILGQGFFAVTDNIVLNEVTEKWETNGEIFYTRAGQFYPDEYGNLQTPQGYYLLGWDRNAQNTEYNQTNVISNFKVVNAATQSIGPIATSEMELAANLQATTETGGSFQVASQVVDRLGTVKTLTMTFTKTGDDPDDTTGMVWDITGTMSNNAYFSQIGPSGIDEFGDSGTNDDILAVDGAGNPQKAVPLGKLSFNQDGSLKRYIPPVNHADAVTIVGTAVDTNEDGVADGVDLNSFDGSDINDTDFNAATANIIALVDLDDDGLADRELETTILNDDQPPYQIVNDNVKAYSMNTATITLDGKSYPPGHLQVSAFTTGNEDGDANNDGTIGAGENFGGVPQQYVVGDGKIYNITDPANPFFMSGYTMNTAGQIFDSSSNPVLRGDGVQATIPNVRYEGRIIKSGVDKDGNVNLQLTDGTNLFYVDHNDIVYDTLNADDSLSNVVGSINADGTVNYTGPGLAPAAALTGTADSSGEIEAELKQDINFYGLAVDSSVDDATNAVNPADFDLEDDDGLNVDGTVEYIQLLRTGEYNVNTDGTVSLLPFVGNPIATITNTTSMDKLTREANGVFDLQDMSIVNNGNLYANKYANDKHDPKHEVMLLTIDHDGDWVTTENNGDRTDIILDFGPQDGITGMTSFDKVSSITRVDQNGQQAGSMTSLSVNSDGELNGLFDNGATRKLYQIPVITFTDPYKLEARSNNVFAATDNSGLPIAHIANTGGAGEIAPASLETSTVDIAEEFTKMIVTQRAYSANTKVITTADEMLDELIRAKR